MEDDTRHGFILYFFYFGGFAYLRRPTTGQTGLTFHVWTTKIADLKCEGGRHRLIGRLGRQTSSEAREAFRKKGWEVLYTRVPNEKVLQSVAFATIVI